MTNVDELRTRLEAVPDPEIGKPLGQTRMLKTVEADDGGAKVVVELPTPAYPERERITAALQSAAGDETPLNVEFDSTVRGMDTGGSIGLKVKNVIAVGSGKGGVGKSSVAVALAYGLQHYGASVGLMDADVYGPSIPHMLGAHGAPAAKQVQGPDGQTIERIEPIVAHGVKCISMGFFVEPEKAVVWRGPLLHRAITQFLQQTEWGELDYLIIDMPPGTGDVSLTLSQSLGLAGAVVVCTPQQVALLDAVKAINMFRQVKIPVLGIVENMSGDIFGRGGAKAKAEEMQVPFLGEIPTDAAIRVKGDEGAMHELFAEESPARPHLLHVTQRMAMEIAKNLLGGEAPPKPTLEVL